MRQVVVVLCRATSCGLRRLGHWEAEGGTYGSSINTNDSEMGGLFGGVWVAVTERGAGDLAELSVERLRR